MFGLRCAPHGVARQGRSVRVASLAPRSCIARRPGPVRRGPGRSRRDRFAAASSRVRDLHALLWRPILRNCALQSSRRCVVYDSARDSCERPPAAGRAACGVQVATRLARASWRLTAVEGGPPRLALRSVVHPPLKGSILGGREHGKRRAGGDCTRFLSSLWRTRSGPCMGPVADQAKGARHLWIMRPEEPDRRADQNWCGSRRDRGQSCCRRADLSVPR